MMRFKSARCARLIPLFLVAIGCGDQHPPTAPSTAPRVELQKPIASCSFPAVTEAARVFAFLEAPQSVGPYTACSRFVLNGDGRFVLQYPHFEYRGTYQQPADHAIVFAWEGWSVAGPWGATGLLEGDRLTISYNDIMMLSDFEDAVYIRTH